MLNCQIYPMTWFLTQRQVTKFKNALNNNMSADIKLRKAQIKKIAQSGGFLGRFLERFLPKMIPAATSVLKYVVAPLGLSAAMSGIDGAIQKSMLGSGITTLKIGNKELNDLMKIKALEGHGVLLKGITKTAQNEVKSQRGGFLSMLMVTLGASLLGDILSKELFGKGLSGGKGMYRSGEGIIRAGQGLKKSH